MKKMMVALAGIVSVLMLASCQKVVEVDGDVSIEKTSYSYRMGITGTASYVLAEEDSWKAKEGAKPVELVVNDAGCVLNWDDYKITNQKDYEFDSMWFGAAPVGKKNLTEDILFSLDDWCSRKLCEHDGDFYWGDVNPNLKVTVKGSPRDKEFTVTATNLHVNDIDGSQKALLTFGLTFSR